MITKAAILERANEWQLTADVVEKDYVLGWLLAGIALGKELGTTWVFKGGTCLKKCILETYRFSEDLDFTLLPDARYTADEIAGLLGDLANRVNELSGIQFPASEITVRARRDLSGQPTFDARIGYAGPMAIPGPPKIRFDITQNEPLLRPAELFAVVHPYPDRLPPGVQVRCYSVPELVAEKTRALFERTRPRDLYDVVLLGSAPPSPADAAKLRVLATEKFAVKGLPLPSVADIVEAVTGSSELRSEWDNMLGHQLPATPPIEDFLERLPGAVAWLDQAPIRPQVRASGLTSVSAKAGETLVAPHGIQVWRGRTPLEAARFAGASHLLIEFTYHGVRRTVEPYSLRRPSTGNLLLYGYEQFKGGFPTNDIRAYKVAEIEDLRVTSKSFRPRYAIELSEQAGVWRW